MKIYGHEKQIQLVREAAANERLAHAYLFYGMDGIGKKLIALDLARSLICPVSAPIACGQCSSCKKALSGNHPDIFVFAAQGQSIKIDDVRLLQEKSILHPFEAKKKIFIVDDADKMTREAANAFLKTLEEPPPSSIFFLITASYRSLLPTVLSRCQKIAFSPLDKKTLAALLIEEDGCEASMAVTIASLADGGVSAAKAMLEEDFEISRRALLTKLQKLLEEKEMGIFGFVKAMGTDRRETQKKLDTVKSLFRDAVAIMIRGKAANVINRDGMEIISGIAGCFSPSRCAEVCRDVDWALKALRFNASRPLLMEALGHKIIGAMK